MKNNSPEIPEHYLIQFRELFTRIGFRSPSMADLANHLSISTKTLYKYVDNKEMLIILVLQHYFRTTKQNLERVNKQNKPAKLRFKKFVLLLGEFFHQIDEKSTQDLEKFYPKAFQFLQNYLNQELKTTLENLLKEGIKHHEFQTIHDSKFITNLLIHHIQLLESGFGSSEMTIQNQYQHLIQFYLSELTIDKMEHTNRK